jgi:hypothetical protein
MPAFILTTKRPVVNSGIAIGKHRFFAESPQLFLFPKGIGNSPLMGAKGEAEFPKHRKNAEKERSSGGWKIPDID